MKILKGTLSAAPSSRQARFSRNTPSRTRTPHQRLFAQGETDELEQRVEDQGRKERQYEAKAKAIINSAPAYKALPTAFDPCPAGKVCYKGVTLTFGGWMTSPASSGAATSPPIPARSIILFPFRKQRTSTRRSRGSRPGKAGLVLAEGDAGADIHLQVMAKSTSRARRRPRARSRQTRSIRGCASSVSFDRTDLGVHVLAGQSWALLSPSKVGIDPRGVNAPGVIDFESVPGFIAARQPGIRVWQDFGPEFKLAASVENPQTSFFGGNTPTVGTPAVGPQGVLNTNLLVNLTGPGGSFFNNANNLSLNQVPDVTLKAAWDPGSGLTSCTSRRGASIASCSIASISPTTPTTPAASAGTSMPRCPPYAGAAGLRRPRRARPLHRDAVPDATLAQDGTILPLNVTAAMVGLIWHTPRRSISTAMPGSKRPTRPSRNVGTVPFGYGNPLYNNTGCISRIRRRRPATAIPPQVQASHRRLLRDVYQGQVRDGQGRRAIFLQPAPGVRRRRRRAEDGRPDRHDPGPLLPVLN